MWGTLTVKNREPSRSNAGRRGASVPRGRSGPARARPAYGPQLPGGFVKKVAFVAALGLVGPLLAGPVSAQPVRPGSDSVAEWNQLALNVVRLKRASDADAARLYAILNVAMYDAVNGLSHGDGHEQR